MVINVEFTQGHKQFPFGDGEFIPWGCLMALGESLHFLTGSYPISSFQCLHIDAFVHSGTSASGFNTLGLNVTT